MAFNEECKFLDKTRMETDKIKHKTMEGVQPLFRRKHPCLSEGNELEWIYECLEDCPYFEQKQD